MKKLLFILPLLAMAISFCSMSPDKKNETTPVSEAADIGGVDRKITWVDFNTGYAKAKKEKKIALIDCYTDWCYWCKRLDKDTYTDSAIIELVNSKFVAIKFNPEKTDVKYVIDGKTYNGMELLSILSNGQSSGYPTTFFIKDKQMLAPFEGYAVPAEFIKTLQEKVGTDNNNNGKVQPRQ